MCGRPRNQTSVKLNNEEKHVHGRRHQTIIKVRLGLDEGLRSKLYYFSHLKEELEELEALTRTPGSNARSFAALPSHGY